MLARPRTSYQLSTTAWGLPPSPTSFWVQGSARRRTWEDYRGVAACFGARRPHEIAGQRPWLSLSEASCRVLAQNHLRRMLKPAVAVLPIGRACGKAFGSRRLEEAVKARNGPLNRWRAQLKVGDRLDVMDNDARRAKRGDLGRWCEAVLVGCTENDRKWWTVHFRGWDARFDEEIDADHAERFLPPYSSVEDWRTNLNEGDEIEVRRPGDHGDARTYWFQGRVVSVAKDEIFVRMQVLDPSVQQLEPWPVSAIAGTIAAKHEHIKREVWLTLSFSAPLTHVRRHRTQSLEPLPRAA